MTRYALTPFRSPRLVALAATLCFAPLATPAVAGGSPPQGPSATRHSGSPTARTAIHTAPTDPIGGSYGVWAAGDSYKVSFHDGATFVPYLGKDYPQTQSFHWRTTSARVGELSLVDGRAPKLRHTEFRAEYDLGGVVEAYDVLPHGLEQTFVVRQRPAASGPLVIEGVVTTGLGADAAPGGHGALTFRDEAGRAILTYGAATAIDAAGRTQPMTTRYADGVIALTLDAAWLESAAYPLVVDPLVGAVSQLGGAEIGSLDMVRASEGVLRIWTAYSRFASATDGDLYGHRIDPDGTNRTAFFTDLTTSWSAEDPSLAYNATSNKGVVAFTRVFPNSQDRHAVRVHAHDRNDLTVLTNVMFLAGAAGIHDWRPDVGGTFSGTAGNDVLVVFQRDEGPAQFANSNTSAVMGVFVETGAETIGVPFPILESNLVDAERPSVNQVSQGTATNYWAVAYQRFPTFSIGNDSWDVEARKIRDDGNVSAPLAVDAAANRHEFAPIIEGQSGDFMVVTASSTTAQVPGKPSTDVGHQIRATRLDFPTDGATGSVPYGTRAVQTNIDARLRVGGLAFNSDSDSHWLVLFASTVTDSLYLRHVGYAGDTIESATLFNGANGNSALGAVSFNSADDEYAVAFGSGGSNLWSVDRFTYAQAAAPTVSGIACSAASIYWTGLQLVGNDDCSVRVLNAPANAVHFLIMASAGANQPLNGIPGIHSGCWLLVPNTGPDHIGVLDFQIGANVSWDLTIPAGLAAGTFYFQDFHTDAGMTELFSTQRLTVPIAR